MTISEARALASFRKAWGCDPAWIARAPGRVNLIGEHTDYNDGFVLPCAIEFETVVAAGPGDAEWLDVIAADFSEERDRVALRSPLSTAGGWRDYVRGVAQVLGDSGALTGARLAIAGNVPPGSGLSSSASVEVAVAHALLAVAKREMPAEAVAQAAQRAENSFVGTACGIMDQLISARGIAGHALLIDCRSLDCRPVPLPPEAAVVIINSGVRHSHAGGEYNDRRAQCEAAARHYGVIALRDLNIAELEARSSGLDATAYRRARHVVTENWRTVRAGEALAAGDLDKMGGLMAASHASMRDDFEITVPEIDALVAIADGVLKGEGGARMTGGGFGGCVVALAPVGKVGELRNAVLTNYRTPGGAPPAIHVCEAAQGASVRPFAG